MATNPITFETGHEEMIHDAQLDYYGKKLATASSDRTIRIFDIGPTSAQLQGQPASQQQQLIATINAHDGPVWQLAWAHPKFGCLLASCSYDGRVIVWKQVQPNSFAKIYEHYKPDTSVNSISFAPHQLGLVLAAARSDGSISVLTRRDDNTWDESAWVGHVGGANAVSWAPQATPIQQAPQQQQQQRGGIKLDARFVSGGCDNRLHIWRLDYNTNTWTEVSGSFTDEVHHTDWIRDAQWAPSMGLPTNTIASCSEDKTVVIWSEEQAPGGSNTTWRKSQILQFEHKPWRVSWSVMGNILAVAQGDNQVSLWKQEPTNGEWINLSQVQEEGVQYSSQQNQPPSQPSATPQQEFQQPPQQHRYQTPPQSQGYNAQPQSVAM